MPRKTPSKEEIAEFMKTMNEFSSTRLEMFAANAGKYAEALGAFRGALQKSGFSAEESMQIILKVVEQPSRRPMYPGWHGAQWQKR